MQVDKTEVTKAKIGQLVGIKTTLTKEQAKNNVPVYRIIYPT